MDSSLTLFALELKAEGGRASEAQLQFVESRRWLASVCSSVRCHQYIDESLLMMSGSNATSTVVVRGSVHSTVNARPRLDAVDLLRGVVMVLDHTRHFFSGANAHDVTDPALFLTRWITHYCAPTFILLTGLSAYLYRTRGKTVAELSKYLIARGLWLILLEFTIIHLAWTFHLGLDDQVAGVIWAIGASMLVLAALIYLPRWAMAAIAIIVIVCHNLLDGIRPEDLGAGSWIWNLLHQPGRMATVQIGDEHISLFVLYPLIPWIGVMAAGYALGPLTKLDPAARRFRLLSLGAAISAGFILLRATNVYGDPVPWTNHETWTGTVLSFLDCEKYPPSLLFLMMTLGPALLLLGALEDMGGPIARWFVTFGRVPFFYYVIHLYLIHGMAVGFQHVIPFGHSMLHDGSGAYKFEASLGAVYLFWLCVVALMYPLCRWFAELKQRHTEWWWSYI
jgi:uncharacterized membrane protein